MAYLLHTVSVLALGAMAPVAASDKVGSLWARLKSVFSKPQPIQSAVMNPPIRTDEGWTFIQCEDPEVFKEWLGKDEKGFPFKEGEYPSLGSHLLIELYGCESETLKYEKSVATTMLDAAAASEATIVTDSFHEFKPFGVSGAVVIQESHYTIHTWPEYRYAAVDLFYCGGAIAVHKAVDMLQERFKPERMKFLVVRRGVQDEVETYA